MSSEQDTQSQPPPPPPPPPLSVLQGVVTAPATAQSETTNQEQESSAEAYLVQRALEQQRQMNESGAPSLESNRSPFVKVLDTLVIYLIVL